MYQFSSILLYRETATLMFIYHHYHLVKTRFVLNRGFVLFFRTRCSPLNLFYQRQMYGMRFEGVSFSRRVVWIVLAGGCRPRLQHGRSHGPITAQTATPSCLASGALKLPPTILLIIVSTGVAALGSRILFSSQCSAPFSFVRCRKIVCCFPYIL